MRWNGAIIKYVDPYTRTSKWRVWTEWGERELPDNFDKLSLAAQQKLVHQAIDTAEAAYGEQFGA